MIGVVWGRPVYTTRQSSEVSPGLSIRPGQRYQWRQSLSFAFPAPISLIYRTAHTLHFWDIKTSYLKFQETYLQDMLSFARAIRVVTYGLIVINHVTAARIAEGQPRNATYDYVGKTLSIINRKLLLLAAPNLTRYQSSAVAQRVSL